jgi:hypothetical protein
MTDEERNRILKQDFFYHVTLRDNLGSIKVNGFNPARSDWTIYRAWLKHPAVFLCTRAALPDAKSMFDNGLDHKPLVVLKVSAMAVAQHECDVDHSFPDRTRGLTFVECLEQVGFIACYGTIPPDLLEVVEHQDEHGRWQSGE